jgi:hypothetical protein
MHRQLLSAVRTTGAGTAITWMGGGGTCWTNNLGGGSARLEISADGTNYETAALFGSTGIVTNTTGDGALHIAPIPAGYQVRGVAISASSTGTDMWISN